jgi:hypothetical protein
MKCWCFKRKKPGESGTNKQYKTQLAPIAGNAVHDEKRENGQPINP